MEIATKVCPVYVHLHNGIIKNFSVYHSTQIAALLIIVYHSDKQPPEVYGYVPHPSQIEPGPWGPSTINDII